MNHASPSPRSELERAAAVRPVREINNVICSLGSRPIRSGPKDFCRDGAGRTSGRSRAFVTHSRGMRAPRVPALRPFSAALLPLRSTRELHSDSRNCQRQRKLSQPLMVFERGRSDAKDMRTHAGQITILLLFSVNWIFSSRAAALVLRPPFSLRARIKGAKVRDSS